jgi:hypothetical protein
MSLYNSKVQRNFLAFAGIIIPNSATPISIPYAQQSRQFWGFEKVMLTPVSFLGHVGKNSLKTY